MSNIKILENNEDFKNEINNFIINLNTLNDINDKYLGQKNHAQMILNHYKYLKEHMINILDYSFSLDNENDYLSDTNSDLDSDLDSDSETNYFYEFKSKNDKIIIDNNFNTNIINTNINTITNINDTTNQQILNNIQNTNTNIIDYSNRKITRVIMKPTNT